MCFGGSDPDLRGSRELNRSLGRPGEGQGGPNRGQLGPKFGQNLQSKTLYKSRTLVYWAEWSGYQDDGAKNGSDFFQRFGHKIGPKAFPDVILAWLDRKFRPGSF